MHTGNARRTEQTEEILSRGAILQLLSLFLNQLYSDFVSIRPVLSKALHPRTLVPLKNPVSESPRGPLHEVENE